MTSSIPSFLKQRFSSDIKRPVSADQKKLKKRKLNRVSRKKLKKRKQNRVFIVHRRNFIRSPILHRKLLKLRMLRTFRRPGQRIPKAFPFGIAQPLTCPKSGLVLHGLMLSQLQLLLLLQLQTSCAIKGALKTIPIGWHRSLHQQLANQLLALRKSPLALRKMHPKISVNLVPVGARRKYLRTKMGRWKHRSMGRWSNRKRNKVKKNRRTQKGEGKDDDGDERQEKEEEKAEESKEEEQEETPPADDFAKQLQALRKAQGEEGNADLVK